MMKRAISRSVFQTAFIGSALLFVAFTHAAEGDAKSKAKAVDPKIEKKIIENLQQAHADIKVEDVSVSPISGVYQVQLTNGPTVYATADAGYFIAGDLFQVKPGQLVNVSQQAMNEQRAQALAKLDEEDMIVFSPEGETKATVTVFTDIDCGYCRKLHQEVPELNKMGIEVRYLAYPRAGVNSESHKKLATAWCAENPQETLTRFKSGESVPLKVCEDNPVAEEYNLGRQLGVTATPALVLESGELQLGYMRAPQLAARLGVSQQ